MKPVTLILALAYAAILTPAQAPQAGVKRSPKQVVEDFCKFETAGGRLNSEGWNIAAASFVRPIPPPAQKTIYVTSSNFSVWDPIFRTDTRADVIVGVLGVWKIDPHMVFSVSSTEMKSFFNYAVVLTDKHWELDADEKMNMEVTGSPEWRIEGPKESIWLTRDTAIRYVKQIRNQTHDFVVKRNAEKTLLQLRRISR